KAPVVHVWPRRLSGPEQSITGVAKTRQNVPLLIQLAVKRSTIDDYIWMGMGKAANAFWRSDQTEKADSCRTGTFEGGNCRCRTSACREHRVKEKEITLCCISGN